MRNRGRALPSVLRGRIVTHGDKSAVSAWCPSNPRAALGYTSTSLSRNHACLQAVLLSRSRFGGDDPVRVRSGWRGVRGRAGAVGRGVGQAQTELVICQASAHICTVHRYSPTATRASSKFSAPFSPCMQIRLGA